MAAMALLRLGRLTGNGQWLQLASQTIEAAGSLIERSVLASGQMLSAIHESLSQRDQLVLVLSDTSNESELIQRLRQLKPVENCGSDLIVAGDPNKPTQNCFDSMLNGKESKDGQSTLYVCSGNSCSEPIVGREAILKYLDQQSVSS